MTTETYPAPDLDRAAGVLVGSACGDALGAGYEFGPPLPDDAPVAMIGGGLGPFAPGEWTDDTAMALVIAQAASDGHDLRSQSGLEAVARAFLTWFAEGPKDIGNQTRAVLSASRDSDASVMTDVSRRLHHSRPDRSAGNGSLMRTGPIALAHLHDSPEVLRDAAIAVSDLTHADPVAGEACAIWSLAIRHAVLYASFEGLRTALAYLPADRAAWWAERLDDAERRPPREFRHNGWVVEALQAAWSAITRTPVPEDDPANDSFAAHHYRAVVEAAVRGGEDTDTVAAIAGALAGARWGVTAVPWRWRRILHGWPGLRSPDLVALGVQAARLSTGRPATTRNGWPAAARLDYSAWFGTDTVVPHPHDDGVLLGGVGVLDHLPDGVDAVVSLCRIGRAQWPAVGVAPQDHVTFWLLDEPGPANSHLDFVLAEAADAVAGLRAEGHRVLLHCVAAHSRTPTVAALYSTRWLGVPADRGLEEVCRVLPDASPNPSFRSAYDRLSAIHARTSSLHES